MFPQIVLQFLCIQITGDLAEVNDAKPANWQKPAFTEDFDALGLI